MRCLDYNPGIVLLIWQLELTDWSFFTLLHMRQFLSHPMSWDAASFHWVGVRFWNIYFVTASQFAVINFPFHHFFFGHPKWCHDHWKLVNWWVDPWIFCSINNGDDPTLFVGRFLWFVKIYHGIQTTTSTFKQRKKITQMHCWVVVTEFVIWMCMCSWANDKWIKSYGNLRCCDISVRELLKPARRHWKRLVPFCKLVFLVKCLLRTCWLQNYQVYLRSFVLVFLFVDCRVT